MKKLMLTAVIALGTLTAMQAQETEIQNPTKAVEEVSAQKEAKLLAKAEVPQTTFKEIKPNALPLAVAEALAKDFEGASLQKAYVNDKQEYKLVLAMGSDDSKAAVKTVFASKDGTWLKKPKAKMKK